MRKRAARDGRRRSGSWHTPRRSGCLPAVDLADIDIDPCAEGVGVGLVGDVADRTGHGARPVGRTLGTVQDLDALDVVKVQVRHHAKPAERTVIEQDCRRRGVRVVAIAAIGYAAAEEHLGAGADAVESHRRHFVRKIVEPHDAEVLQVLRRQHVDADGNVLHVLHDLAGRDDHFLQSASARGCRRDRVRGVGERGAACGCRPGQRCGDRHGDSGAGGTRWLQRGLGRRPGHRNTAGLHHSNLPHQLILSHPARRAQVEPSLPSSCGWLSLVNERSIRPLTRTVSAHNLPRAQVKRASASPSAARSGSNSFSKCCQ